jgi:hypothetical protein
MEELLEVVFSVRPVPTLYGDDQLPIQNMAASQRGRYPESKGT